MDPDVALVEWLLNNTEQGADTTDEDSKIRNNFSQITNANSGTSFRESEISLSDGSDASFNLHPITRERFKRDDDGRGIAFHQCYWNPVSCFR